MTRNAEIIRELRKKAIAAGLCSTCRCRPQKRPGVNHCVHCLERGKVTRSRLTSEGRCVCGAPATSGQLCDRCRTTKRASDRRYKARIARVRIDGGMCRACPHADAEQGRTHCSACIAKQTVRFAQTSERNRNAGLCACGAERTEGYRSCEDCRAYWRSYQELREEREAA